MRIDLRRFFNSLSASFLGLENGEEVATTHSLTLRTEAGTSPVAPEKSIKREVSRLGHVVREIRLDETGPRRGCGTRWDVAELVVTELEMLVVEDEAAVRSGLANGGEIPVQVDSDWG